MLALGAHTVFPFTALPRDGGVLTNIFPVRHTISGWAASALSGGQLVDKRPAAVGCPSIRQQPLSRMRAYRTFNFRLNNSPRKTQLSSASSSILQTPAGATRIVQDDSER